MLYTFSPAAVICTVSTVSTLSTVSTVSGSAGAVKVVKVGSHQTRFVSSIFLTASQHQVVHVLKEEEKLLSAEGWI